MGCGSDSKIGGDGVPDAGGADADPGYVAPIVCESVAGNRLSREYIEPVPGARQEFRIMDTLHDVECRYRAENDGSYSCYPVGTSATSLHTFCPQGAKLHTERNALYKLFAGL